jgi:hypothetical protein
VNYLEVLLRRSLATKTKLCLVSNGEMQMTEVAATAPAVETVPVTEPSSTIVRPKFKDNSKRIQLTLTTRQIEWLVVRALQAYADQTSAIAGTNSSLAKLELYGNVIPDDLRAAIAANANEEMKRREEAIGLAGYLSNLVVAE